MDSELFLEMIYISLVTSMISTQMIQKIKDIFDKSRTFNKIISLFVSFGVGFGYTISFYTSSVLYAVWIGVFTLIGAEGLYKMFSDKGYFGLVSKGSVDGVSK